MGNAAKITLGYGTGLIVLGLQVCVTAGRPTVPGLLWIIIGLGMIGSAAMSLLRADQDAPDGRIRAIGVSLSWFYAIVLLAISTFALIHLARRTTSKLGDEVGVIPHALVVVSCVIYLGISLGRVISERRRGTRRGDRLMWEQFDRNRRRGRNDQP